MLTDFTQVSVTAHVRDAARRQGRLAVQDRCATWWRLARKDPGKLNLGAINPGSTQNLSAHLFKQIDRCRRHHRPLPDHARSGHRDAARRHRPRLRFLRRASKARSSTTSSASSRPPASSAIRCSRTCRPRRKAACRIMSSRAGTVSPAAPACPIDILRILNQRDRDGAGRPRTCRRRRSSSASMPAAARPRKCATAWRATSSNGEPSSRRRTSRRNNRDAGNKHGQEQRRRCAPSPRGERVGVRAFGPSIDRTPSPASLAATSPHGRGERSKLRE